MRQLSQSVCMGVTLSLGWLGKPEPRSGGAVYVSNRVRHSNQARRALGSRRPHSNRVSSNRVRHSNQARRALGSRRPHSNRVSSNRVLQLSQSVCMGVTLSLGWLGKPEPRSGGAAYVSNRVRHWNLARRALRRRWSVVGFGAQAVSRKTPIYLIQGLVFLTFR